MKYVEMHFPVTPNLAARRKDRGGIDPGGRLDPIGTGRRPVLVWSEGPKWVKCLYIPRLETFRLVRSEYDDALIADRGAPKPSVFTHIRAKAREHKRLGLGYPKSIIGQILQKARAA